MAASVRLVCLGGVHWVAYLTNTAGLHRDHRRTHVRRSNSGRVRIGSFCRQFYYVCLITSGRVRIPEPWWWRLRPLLSRERLGLYGKRISVQSNIKQVTDLIHVQEQKRIIHSLPCFINCLKGLWLRLRRIQIQAP